MKRKNRNFIFSFFIYIYYYPILNIFEPLIINSGNILEPISDTKSKTHGAMDIVDASPLRSCAKGGRKVIMIAAFPLSDSVEPRFELYDAPGNRLLDEERSMLNQPADQSGETVSTLKETIVFITPPQPHSELILENQWEVKLVAKRTSDGLVSKTKFNFEFLPHDFFSPCIFCTIDLDKRDPGNATLASPIHFSRPGLKRRMISNIDAEQFNRIEDDIDEDKY